MNYLRLLHESAMEFNTYALRAIGMGKPEEAHSFYKQAFELEKKSALLSYSAEDQLPHLILMRSAAALAKDAGLWDEAINLINISREKKPPQWLLTQLEEIEDLVEKDRNSNTESIKSTIKGKVTEVNSGINEVIIMDKKGMFFSLIFPRELMKNIFENLSEEVSVDARQSKYGTMFLEKIQPAA